MEDLLYLAHRLPYPPNKGDKIRSYHEVRLLAQHYRVHLGTFIDDPRDARYVSELQKHCASMLAIPLNPRWAKLASLRGLLTNQALTLPYYRHARLQQWVDQTIRTYAVHKAVVFSSPMVQYLDRHLKCALITDFCDVDSAKWSRYAAEHRWPASWIYAREGQRLLAFEQQAACRSVASLFATSAELTLFQQCSPTLSHKVALHAIGNGVDSDYFSPEYAGTSPYVGDEPTIVFTGVMDYLPNIDAVTWCAQEILPRIRTQQPRTRFVIVGMNPTTAVQELAQTCPGVQVTGRVDDVRSYLAHADVVVAPLRIARGIQNKVLEAMSMARPVVMTPAPAAGLIGQAGVDFATADSAADFAIQVLSLLRTPRGVAMGQQARARVQADYDWDSNLARLLDLVRGA